VVKGEMKKQRDNVHCKGAMFPQMQCSLEKAKRRAESKCLRRGITIKRLDREPVFKSSISEEAGQKRKKRLKGGGKLRWGGNWERKNRLGPNAHESVANIKGHHARIKKPSYMLHS